MIAPWIHIEIPLETLDACIADVRPIEKGEQEEEEEDGDDVEIAFPEEFAFFRAEVKDGRVGCHVFLCVEMLVSGGRAFLIFEMDSAFFLHAWNFSLVVQGW